MALTKAEKEQFDEMRDTLTALNTVILGTDGYNGLAQEVKDIAKGYGNLKRRFYMLIAFLVGSGVLGGSIAGALLGGG